MKTGSRKSKTRISMVHNLSLRLQFVSFLSFSGAAFTLTAGGAVLGAAENPILNSGGQAPAVLPYNVGLIPPSTSRIIDHLFTIHNSDSKKSMTLDHLAPSCGCAGFFVLGKSGSDAMIVPPGKDVYVDVTIDPRLLTPGPFTKSVQVYVKGRKQALVELDMNGQLLPAAAFTPKILDFGSGQAGHNRSLTFSATLDPGLLPTGMSAQLESSDPDLLITPVSAAGAGSNTTTYNAELSSNAHLGSFMGRIAMVLTTVVDGKAEVFPAGSLSISGSVLGEISAIPGVISFGTVKAGSVGEQAVVISGASADALTGLVMTSSDDNLSETVDASSGALQHLGRPFGASDKPSSDSTKGTTAALLLHLTLGPKTPVGPFHGWVTITTNNNQQLQMPVYANVVPAQG